MEPENKICANCKAVLPCAMVANISRDRPPLVIVSCRQKLSDHYKHYVEPTHSCGWHSYYLKKDPGFPDWEKSIDKEGIDGL